MKRKFQFTSHIDHLQNPNKVISEKMEQFFATTRNPKNPVTRDTSLTQASKELERQQIKILHANRMFNSSNAYKEEMVLKKAFFNQIVRNFPAIHFNEHEIHSMTYEQMRIEITNRIQSAKILGAVLKIQKWFKRSSIRKSLWEVYITRHNAAKMI